MEKPMEHLKQWHDCYQGTLTANETALYIHLFMIANRRRWPEWVEITDAQLAFIANIRERTIPDILNSLVQRGLIVSRRKKGKAPSVYQIVDLSRSYPVKNDVISPRYDRDITEISPRYDRDKSEISPRLEENSTCESKDGKASKTKTKTTQHKDIEKEIQKKKRVDVFMDSNETEEVKKALRDFLEMRNRIKSPMTNRAKELLLSELNKLSDDPATKVKILEQSICHSWKSVYEIKEGVQHGGNSGNRGTHKSPEEERRKWDNEPNGWKSDLAI